MMRILRIVVLIVFIGVSAIFAKYYYSEVRSEDKTLPVIKVEEELISVSTKVENDEFLVGLSAYDEKDGDITDKIIVESISKFYEPGVCKITYAVCDSDNHVATATRKVRYEGYTAPKFTLERPLLFNLGERVNLSAIVGAVDCLEGDISHNVIVTSNDYKSGQQGIFHVEMKVSNTKGDIVTLRAPMIIEEKEVRAPEILLTHNIVYTTAGHKLNLEKYIDTVTDAEGNEIDPALVTINSEIKYKVPGAYSVHYNVTDSLDRNGHTILTVVVTEN